MVLKKDGDTGRELSKRVSCMQLEKKRTRHTQAIQGGAKILSTHQGASFANSMDFNLSHFTLHEAISNSQLLNFKLKPTFSKMTKSTNVFSCFHVWHPVILFTALLSEFLINTLSFPSSAHVSNFSFGLSLFDKGSETFTHWRKLILLVFSLYFMMSCMR